MAIETGTGDYSGILYRYSSESSYLLYPNADKYQGATSQYREPVILDAYDTEEGITDDILQKEYNKMIESIKKYGGFYVGRYETSYNSTTNNVASVSGVIPASASNKNTYKWYGLYSKEKSYSTIAGYNSVQSSMIWGSQYDAMINWALNGDDKSKITIMIDGNNQGGSLEECGSYGNDKINNIYDLGGNILEWTLEAHDECDRAYHGASIYQPVTPSHRSEFSPDRADYDLGSRLSLYIKN